MRRISQLITQGELTPPAALATLRASPEPVAATIPTSSHTLKQALLQLDSLVGLSEVKQLVYEIKAYVEIQQRRSEKG